MEIKNWLKSTGVGVVKNTCGHSGRKILLLAVSQEEREKLIFCMLIQIQGS